MVHPARLVDGQDDEAAPAAHLHHQAHEFRINCAVVALVRVAGYAHILETFVL